MCSHFQKAGELLQTALMSILLLMNSPTLNRLCTGDGVVGGVIGVKVRMDRSIGDGKPVCRKINGGK